jgi:D-alanyl-D-alanine carboxypeptidase/D-alanyl-D-alanine-endopeptidase (penicillin-binding protein 4)
MQPIDQPEEGSNKIWPFCFSQFTVHCSLLTFFFLFLTFLLITAQAFADVNSDIASLLKENDACILLAPDGREIVSVHPDTPLIPASILKIYTALIGFHYLGEEYRFPTDIHFSSDGDLTLKGYGDPLLISEVLQELAEKIRDHLPKENPAIRNIVLDDTYFTSPLTIPGVSDSDQPYDAPNGALCANFNTIKFERRGDGSYVSGEAQTPMLPTVLARVRQTGLEKGRIPLSHDREETTGYTGHLLSHFLRECGVKVTGSVLLSDEPAPVDTRIMTFESPYSLSDLVSKLLEYSNNFMANQIFIAAGAATYGPPGNLEKGIRAAEAYAVEAFGLEGLNLAEGSGISRATRVTAHTMSTVLKAFEPHRVLLRRANHSYYKTGTLKGIATRVGYLLDTEENCYPFVIILNASEKKMEEVIKHLKEIVNG